MGMRRIILLLASMALAVIFGSGVALADSPTTKEDCKHGGYAKYGFKNEGQCIKAVNQTDATSPDTTITSGPASGSFVSDSTPTWSFEADEAGVTFECRVTTPDSPPWVAPWESCTSPYTAPEQPESEGDWSMFWVRATDAAGNVETEPATRDFQVDTVGPITTIHGPFDSSGVEKDVVNENDISFSLQWHEEWSGQTPFFECKLEGPSGSGQWEPCRRNGGQEGSNIPNYFDLADGDYVLSVRGTDKAGNVGEPDTRAFTVDTTP
jgi:hypothetical protein